MSKNYYVGIDISKKTLDVRLYSHPDNNRLENYVRVFNSDAGLKSLLKWFKSKRIKLDELVVCIEHTGIYGLNLCSFLEFNSIDYSALSGLHIRRSLGVLRGKDDNIDAGRIARYCYLHRDELVYSQMKSAILLRIQFLMSERRCYVKRSAQSKSYIAEFKGKGYSDSIDRYEVDLKYCRSQIKLIEREILEVVSSDPDLKKNYDLLVSITGVAFVNAVNTILYTNNFTSFSNARAYACYCGVAPFGYKSGTSINSPARVSKLCNKMLKSDLSQSALSAVSHDPELRAYYQRKIASGKSPGCVLNAVKFKLIERMFAVVKRGVPYVKLATHLS